MCQALSWVWKKGAKNEQDMLSSCERRQVTPACAARRNTCLSSTSSREHVSVWGKLLSKFLNYLKRFYIMLPTFHCWEITKMVALKRSRMEGGRFLGVRVAQRVDFDKCQWNLCSDRVTVQAKPRRSCRVVCWHSEGAVGGGRGWVPQAWREETYLGTQHPARHSQDAPAQGRLLH